MERIELADIPRPQHVHNKLVEAALADKQLVDYLQRSQSKRAYVQVCPAQFPWCSMCCRHTREVCQLSANIFVQVSRSLIDC